MSEFVEYTVPVWRGLDMRQLKVDEAYIILKSFYNKVTYLYTLSDACYTCPYTKEKALQPNIYNETSFELNANNVLKINTAHPYSFKLFEKDVGRYAFDNESALSTYTQKIMEEFGVYNLTFYDNGTNTFETDKKGVNVNFSLLSVFVLVGLILLVIKIANCAWRSYRYEETVRVAENAQSQSDEAAVTAQRRRMQSLDAFRGVAIVLMIFVNSGGGDYWWIEHAPWNGLHLADVVFPSFLWIMGVCIPISVKSQMGRGVPKLKICLKIIERSLKLFAIGLCLNSINGPNLEKLRVMGVLQRFGIAYLVCGIVHTIFCKRDQILMPQVPWKRTLYDLILLRGEFITMLTLIVIYLGISFGLYVPNCPRGYLGPGGKHDNAAYVTCIGGATGYIDLQILGDSHIYQHPTAKYIYDSQAFDPEGLFGCLLTVVQVLFGVLAGVIILVHNAWYSRINRWLLWSICLALLGGALCAFTKEDGLIPINKNLWSLSFVFITSSLAFVMLSVFYFIIDIKHWWTGFPFVEAGKNAIIMYVGHTIMHKLLPWHWRIGAMNTHFVLLLESVWNTLLWIAIALYLNHKKFYYSL
ncbi:heparan-alpha-glucosaminide N-acetyltransferase-like [Teleopsis dalmanni]|uniref:heparan-alpha-glucosaminide N-acetyltransferase-like n=1 Tax=Teleopsis dalmanni TaxID=139649 RepID=UPI0018CDD483|nr:heparan-alpha-glucosaminide N-acetyltransferase-like [Teleopsis dalmanni]